MEVSSIRRPGSPSIYALQGSERMRELINGLREYSRVNRQGGSTPLEMDHW